MLNFEKFVADLKEVGLNFAIDKSTRTVKPCAGGEYNQCQTCLFGTDEYFENEYACDVNRLHWLFQSEFDQSVFTLKEKHFLLIAKTGTLKVWKTLEGKSWAEYIFLGGGYNFNLEEFDCPFTGLPEGEYDVEQVVNEIYFINE